MQKGAWFKASVSTLRTLVAIEFYVPMAWGTRLHTYSNLGGLNFPWNRCGEALRTVQVGYLVATGKCKYGLVTGTDTALSRQEHGGNTEVVSADFFGR